LNRTILLLVTSLASFAASLLSTAVSVALPSIARTFSMEAQLLGWVATSFVLATAVMMIPIGRIADIYGRHRIFSYGLVLFIVASILCAVSPSAMFLVSFRIVQGIGAAMIWGPAVAILTSAFPFAERGRAIGINTAAVYCGLSVGPFWGGMLTEVVGWQSVFYFTALLVTLAAILAFWQLKGERTESAAGKMDIKGSVTLIISLILILYGFSTLPNLVSIPLISLGFIGILMFYRIEVKKANPVLDVSLFRNNKVFICTLLAILLLYCATFAPNFLLSLYLQYNKGFSPGLAGAILVVQPVVMAIVAPISGRISDKVSPAKLSLLGMGVTCIALILFSFLSEETTLLFIFASLIILGLGFGLFASPATNAVMSSVDKKFFGVAAGMMATLRHSGQTLSMAIVMILFAVYVGKVEITPPLYPAFLESLKTGFAIFAFFCFAGILALLVGSKLSQDK
jgi:EmrB/QacA subfamily drug resistance transporter